MTAVKIGVVAVALAFALATAASARQFSLSHQEFRIVWAPLEFSGAEGAVSIRCVVTMEGSFHARTLAKVVQALVGYITRSTVATSACTGGRMATLAESLPWHVRYGSFSGALPNITSIALEIVGLTFLFEDGLMYACLYTATAASPAGGSLTVGAGGRISGFSLDGTRAFPLTRRLGGVLACPSTMRLNSSANVTASGMTTAITVLLI